MNHSTKRLVLTALLAALTCVATLIITVPSPTGGFMNLGDTIVLLSAYLLGPLWGAAAAGIGSAMADMIAGYALYVPATLVIKGTMALLAALLYRALDRKSQAILLCGFLAEAMMVLGYWGYDGLLMGSLAGAAVGIPSNLMQALFGLAASSALALALKANPYIRREFPDL
ncbi:MAG: ECF transporter S component [Oscillibacter sp.]|nr:ECF transporter S component [Oscillibacter sp.]